MPCSEKCKMFRLWGKVSLVGHASRKESSLLPHEVITWVTRHTKERELIGKITKAFEQGLTKIRSAFRRIILVVVWWVAGSLRKQEIVSEIWERHNEELKQAVAVGMENKEWVGEICGWYCLYLVTNGMQRVSGNDSLKWDSNFWRATKWWLLPFTKTN